MSRMLKLAAAVSVITIFPAALATASAENLKVVASFSIIADFAKNVGGDRVDITTLVGPNGDAHVFEPKPSDAAAVGAADVVLVNGLQFEGFLQRLVEASGTKAPVVELTKGGEVLKNTEGEHSHDDDEAAEGEQKHEAGESHEHAHEGHHHHGEFDPHAWQSVRNAEIYVKNITDAFCAADAAGCDTYQANAEAYGEQLEALEGEIKTAVAEIPDEKRAIITSHDAFGYFEHEYGLKFLAPEGVSTESEASATDVAALIKQVKEDKAAAIFLENITNPRLIEQIASETGINVGGTLYSDALSDERGPAATYIDMMKYNVNTIKGAILGS
ncbi:MULTISPECIES: zinc ABC transporter substrate-binding protein AztC [unclassified Mesorhizobium]|uniref:zinc ABC transporter substrate-binding protein AztC n=1 Tax=unclassified Mesorhizobium TaxID=325217 RepID=UPI000FE932E4|nr:MULTISPECIES: zinc ABC transporter substrate-binding protein AztC [unclassified Mesorhizobium]RWB98672.1 MAG: metal ABC transporter substrate-binding protein [Mesorhizobium sp.]TGV21926.1 metal ABC transporter substrate-binding protein [Mesorhizobium sp. M4B.F.Ca.ET.143.01.1.1]